jgi:cytochrome c oxidase subunit 2
MTVVARLAKSLVAVHGSADQLLASPMSYLRTYGPRADPATALMWGLIFLSLAVVAIITVLVILGVLVRRRRGRVEAMAALPAQRGGGGLAWFYVGMPLTVVALVGALAWTVAVLAAVDSPVVKPRLTIEVTGHQWWWEARYLSANPNETFVTANEIHIPTGEPVLVKLVGADVIHSFWIPALTGKTDTIPGQTNIAWLQTGRPGVYHGQCAEFCGVQHAHMGLDVVAQPPAVFEAWRHGQLLPANAPVTRPQIVGQVLFGAHCGACHAVRGTDLNAPSDSADPVSLATLASEAVPGAGHPSSSGGVVGPDLTHVMSRSTLAAGTVPNTVGGLSGWIANPQALKPGAQMPATYLSGSQLSSVVSYLETLR